MAEISEQALIKDLETHVKEALKKHSVEDVLEILRHELWQLEMQTLYATKDGFGGAPNYRQLIPLINATKKVIEKLEKGEIKGPKPPQWGRSLSRKGFP